MAFLRLNGITIPCRLGSPAPELELVGESSRAVDASLVTERRAVKGVWGFETTAQAPATALAIRDLLAGRAQSWAFDSHLYSSKGLGPNSTTGLSVDAVVYKYGAGSLAIAANAMPYAAAYAAGLGSSWTAALWRKQGAGAWTHYVITSGGQKWVDGVRNDAATTTWFSAMGTVTLTGDATDQVNYDDVWLCPWVWPTTWPPMAYAFGAAIAPAGQLKADGDVIENSGRVVTVQPEALAMRVTTGNIGGTRYTNLQTVAGRLVEV